MAYLNDTDPADSDAVKKGANSIRSLKTALNVVVGQIFDDTGAFLTGWIESAQIGNKQVKTANIDDSAVTATQLANGAVTAAKIPDATIEASKLASDFQLPASAIAAGLITQAMIADGAVGNDEIAEGAVTLDKLSAPNLFSKIYMGTILIPENPLNNVPVTISGVNPDFVILFSMNVRTGIIFPVGSALIAFRSEQVSGYSGAQISRYRGFDGGVPYNFDPLRTGGIIWTGNGFAAQCYDFTDGHGINGANQPPLVNAADTTLIYLAVVA